MNIVCHHVNKYITIIMYQRTLLRTEKTFHCDYAMVTEQYGIHLRYDNNVYISLFNTYMIQVCDDECLTNAYHIYVILYYISHNILCYKWYNQLGGFIFHNQICILVLLFFCCILKVILVEISVISAKP